MAPVVNKVAVGEGLAPRLPTTMLRSGVPASRRLASSCSADQTAPLVISMVLSSLPTLIEKACTSPVQLLVSYEAWYK